jgi:hypothetical protein
MYNHVTRQRAIYNFHLHGQLLCGHSVHGPSRRSDIGITFWARVHLIWPWREMLAGHITAVADDCRRFDHRRLVPLVDGREALKTVRPVLLDEILSFWYSGSFFPPKRKSKSNKKKNQLVTENCFSPKKCNSRPI